MLLREPYVLRLYGDVPVLALTPLAGSRFVQRMLTVVTTLKSQRRNVLEFMTQAVSAKRQGQPTPSLLPQVPAE
jgi:hypothetical protein